MPTIKTIKPAGGGDYTTLAAWWTARKTSGNANEWAECYSGNLGELSMTSMTGTPTSTNFPKIYAASGHRHNGIDLTSGAYISPSSDIGLQTWINFTHVDGIAATIDPANAGSGCFVTVDGVTGVVMENCLAIGSGSDNANDGFLAACYGTVSVVFRNCIARDFAGFDSFLGWPGAGFCFYDVGIGGTFTGECDSCTAHNCQIPFLLMGTP